MAMILCIKGTDHTREYVPLVFTHRHLKMAANCLYGTLLQMSEQQLPITSWLQLPKFGESFLRSLIEKV